MPGRYNGQVWNLGHSWSGALPQSGPHVLQRRPGSHRGVRHNKRGESGGRFCVVCFLSAAPFSVTTVGLTFLVMRWGVCGGDGGCSRLNVVKFGARNRIVHCRQGWGDSRGGFWLRYCAVRTKIDAYFGALTGSEMSHHKTTVFVCLGLSPNNTLQRIKIFKQSAVMAIWPQKLLDCYLT